MEALALTRARFLLSIGKIQNMAGSQHTSPYRLNSPPPSERPTIRERIKDNIDRPSLRVLSILVVVAVLFGLGRIALAFVPMNCSGHKCPTTLEYGMSVLIGLLILAAPFVVGLFCYMLYDIAGDALKAIKREL